MEKSEVLMTKNYDMFKTLKGNRAVNENHVNTIVRSMRDKYVPVPIIVNGKYQIIDGQHRVAACQITGLPVYYIKGSDYDLRDVQKINSASKNWTPNDLAKSFAELGNENYQIYLDFKDEYGFDKGATISMLSGTTSEGGNNNGIGANADFKNGLFKVRNLKYAKECAEKIYQVEPFYPGFKRRSFIIAMLHLFQHKNYNHKQFLGKLEFLSQKMVDCVDTVQYIKLIENIYNWKNQDKVRFF
jgi:hypothetical protein